MTLTEFLLARLTEDEAAARAAAGEHGVYPGTWWGQEAGGEPSGVSSEDGAHIARHDPARVLAECEAKRRIVDALEDERQRKDIYNRDFDLGLLTTDGDLRSRLSSNARWAGLEVAVRALASIYAD